MWALGCIFYELLNGVKLFSNDFTVKQILAGEIQQLFAKSPILESVQAVILPTIWDTVEVTVLRLLSVDPSERPTADRARRVVALLFWSLAPPAIPPIGLPSVQHAAHPGWETWQPAPLRRPLISPMPREGEDEDRFRSIYFTALRREYMLPRTLGLFPLASTHRYVQG